jgi:hypothetical protein
MTARPETTGRLGSPSERPWKSLSLVLSGDGPREVWFEAAPFLETPVKMFLIE